MKYLLEDVQSGRFYATDTVSLSPNYSFIKMALHNKILSASPDSWNDDVSYLQFTPQAFQETLNIYVVLGELRNRFPADIFDITKVLVNTISAERRLINEYRDCVVVSNIITFLVKAYSEDISYYKMQPIEPQFGFLLAVDIKLLYWVLNKYLDMYYEIIAYHDAGSLIYSKLMTHLTSYNIDNLCRTKAMTGLFIDVLPDYCLLRLFYLVFIIKSPINTLQHFTNHCINHYFGDIIYKIKDEKVLWRIANDVLIYALNGITNSEFLGLIEKLGQQFGIQLIHSYVIDYPGYTHNLMPQYLTNGDIRNLKNIQASIYETISNNMTMYIKVLRQHLLNYVSTRTEDAYEDEWTSNIVADIILMRDCLLLLQKCENIEQVDQISSTYEKICSIKSVLRMQ